MTNEEMYEALVKRIDKMDGNLSTTMKEVGNLSTRIEEVNENLSTRIDKMDENLSTTMKEVGNLSTRIEEVNENLSTTIHAMRSDLERQIREVNVTLETEVIPPLNTMSACYTSTYDKYVKGICRDRATAVEIEQLKETVADHSQRLQAAGL